MPRKPKNIKKQEPQTEFYTLTVTKAQLYHIKDACEAIARMGINQWKMLFENYYLHREKLMSKECFELVRQKFTEIEDIVRADRENFRLNKNEELNEVLRPTFSRILWDLYTAIRHRLAYDNNPDITPENRWQKEGGWVVCFDEPHHESQEPTAKIQKL